MGQSVIDEKLAAARELAKELADGEAVNSIYIAGSLTAGLGNPTSDADLFILTGEMQTPGDDVTQFNVSGHRVDVERYSLQDARDLVAAVVSFETRRDNLTSVHGLLKKLDFTVRLLNSETVVDSAELVALKQQIVDNLPTVQRAAINYAASTMNGHLEDFLGAVADEDFDTAAFVGHRLVGQAGKALAAAAGDLYVSEKWVYKQLLRNSIEEFPLEEFTAYQRGSWIEGGAAAADDLLFFVQTCMAASQLLGAARVPLNAWPARFGTHKEQDGGLWRHPSFNVFQVNDGVLLHWELHRQLVLRTPAAFVWALCDGRHREDIFEALQTLSEHIPELSGLTAERVDRIVAALTDRGLVNTAPSSATAWV
ncbi:hypothetical protein G3I40_03475 [Streptomyces sp. SID14478]|uniref:PqqD family peptide modification chaperone n=1 Tax=Streptomyces sp. SID14478 TaxID=2706073 RepID=UPI0013DCEED9|nr:PqqD family peptide modification chaperone [Streptomyces sp. SID14478]NEB74301.1 hypothetical protein [Streptomyces sp. SID14478]